MFSPNIPGKFVPGSLAGPCLDWVEIEHMT